MSDTIFVVTVVMLDPRRGIISSSEKVTVSPHEGQTSSKEVILRKACELIGAQATELAVGLLE